MSYYKKISFFRFLDYLLAIAVTYYFDGVLCMIWDRKREQAIQPNVINTNSTSETTVVQSRISKYSQHTDCPICFEDIKYEVETNCGHVFCCQCWITYAAHARLYNSEVHCPYCTKAVKIVRQFFSEAELLNSSLNDLDAVREVDKFLQEIRTYNRRYSGELRTFSEIMSDLSTLLRDQVKEFFSELREDFHRNSLVSFMNLLLLKILIVYWSLSVIKTLLLMFVGKVLDIIIVLTQFVSSF